MNLSSRVKKGITSMLRSSLKHNDYFSENYELLADEHIGAGGFGTVYKVKAKNGDTFAVKRIDIDYEANYSDESIPYTSEGDALSIHYFVLCCQEAILQSEVFSHPNIVRIHDKWIQPNENHSSDVSVSAADNILAIVEFLETGKQKRGPSVLPITPDVREALVNTEGLSFYLVMDLYDMDLKQWLSLESRKSTDGDGIIRQLIYALSYIHADKGYCHLDLKPSNILIKLSDGYTEAAITDFGLSRLVKFNWQATSNGRPGMPPYNLAPDPYFTDKFDMWSFGLIVYEILSKGGVTMQELNKLCSIAKREPDALQKFLEDSLNGTAQNGLCSVIPQCLCSTNKRVSSKQIYKTFVSDDSLAKSTKFPIRQADYPSETDTKNETEDYRSLSGAKRSQSYSDIYTRACRESVEYFTLVSLSFGSPNKSFTYWSLLVDVVVIPMILAGNSFNNMYTAAMYQYFILILIGNVVMIPFKYGLSPISFSYPEAVLIMFLEIIILCSKLQPPLMHRRWVGLRTHTKYAVEW